MYDKIFMTTESFLFSEIWAKLWKNAFFAMTTNPSNFFKIFVSRPAIAGNPPCRVYKLLDGNRPFCVFEPTLEGFRATCDDHCRLIGKRISVNWTFSLGVTVEVLRANIGSKSATSLQWGPVDPKFQIKGVAPTNHSSCQKIKLNDLLYGIKIWTDLSSVLSQFTRLMDRRADRQTDRQTDRRTDSFLITSPRWHSMQRGDKTGLRLPVYLCIRLWALSR